MVVLSKGPGGRIVEGPWWSYCRRALVVVLSKGPGGRIVEGPWWSYCRRALVVVLSKGPGGRIVEGPWWSYSEAAEPGGGGGGHWGHVPPHFSPQSMKCPTSTGVHARPTMYQEGVPRGAI